METLNQIENEMLLRIARQLILKNCRFHIVCLLVWFMPFTLFSQRYISGRITDAEDGSPVPAATVFFTNTTVGITTDAEGNYRLQIPGEGSYRLTVSHVGYQPVIHDIEPGRTSVQFDVAMLAYELDDVEVSAGIRFRQRDISLFWSKILGKNPSRRTIQATNPEAVYYYYNPETRILKVLCREPLEIINYETGYHIQYLLDNFTHDYNTDITNWDYQSIFTELEPATNRQQNNWEKKRKEVYNVSIPKFIKSLYNNTLLNDGFIVTPLQVSGQSDPRRGMSDRFGQSALINPDDILSKNSTDVGKLLSLEDKQIMLVCFGKPVTNYDIASLPSIRSGGRRWEQTNSGIFRNLLHADVVRIFPDGTYTNRLSLSSLDILNPLLMGLSMTLPVDYLPEAAKIEENTRPLAYGLDDIDQYFDRQLEAYPQEKIHLHTDRDFYVPGEKIWFKAYVADAATHRYPTSSRYVYVELIGPADTLVSRVLIRQTDDLFYGHLPITEVIPEGNYTLCAYTRYMENLGDDYFFKKNIRIGRIDGGNGGNRGNGGNLAFAQNDFEVSFFPEGGNLVEGVLTKIAFKALNGSGYSETISGILIDETGVEITDVRTMHAGMGMFAYTPLSGKKYFLKCQNENGLEKQFELPQPDLRSYTLAASPRGNNLWIEVQRSTRAPDTPLYLLAHCRGMILHFAEWEKERKAGIFALDEFPAGVIQFVLFDSQINPLSERLVFNKNEMSEKIEFQIDKEVYKIRDRIVVSLSPSLSPSPVGRAGEGSDHFSVAVTDDKDIAVDESTTILSSLLLSSELKGYIENPAWYLQDNPASNVALDLLMMTHGWRRYNVPEMVKGNMEYPKVPFQESQEISGNVKSLILSRPVPASEILLFGEDGDVSTTLTDANGLFILSGLEFPDSTSFFIQALNSRGNDNVQIAVDKESFPRLVYALQSPRLAPALSEGEGVREGVEKEVAKIETETNAFLAKAELRAKYDETMWVINLDEVSVTARRIEKEDNPRFRFWANAFSSATISRETIEKNRMMFVTDYIEQFITGVRVTAEGLIYIRNFNTANRAGNGLPLVLIDGREYEWPAIMNFKLQSPVEKATVAEIESIDIFKGYSAALFGMRGANGVISITTKRGENSPLVEKPNHTIHAPFGYQKPVEFYSPKYETLEARQSLLPDYRTTIFWKPDVVISGDSDEASFKFYSSDFPTTYSVVIEGLTVDGRIVRQVEKIRVE